MQKWGDAPDASLAVEALAGWHGAKAPTFPAAVGVHHAAGVGTGLC